MHYSELNYKSYQDYLDGEGGSDWSVIHNLAWENIKPYHCSDCFTRKHLLLHKRSYAHLDAAFFKQLIRDKKFELFNMILTWKCIRCNDLCHFYDKEKKQKVPLDYLFLILREDEIHEKINLKCLRAFRRLERAAKWTYYTYRSIFGGKRRSRIT